MLWGGISIRGRKPLATIKGIINSEVYCNILNDYLIPPLNILYPQGYKLQEDNAPVHKSKWTTNWKREHGIEFIDWPPNSPDLNPIENVWGLMKRKISEENLKTVSVWKRRIEELWSGLSDEYMKSLVDSMPRRIEECIANNGRVTKY